uniref:Uncharacterized protein n=1 Tax=Nelumbo nucifera TaxID=4432 RepID=A0A822XQ73_NELNU|nr:TPA_asm: hypothetical protein HUJ06_021081 [Nelumbo nucifera]
MIGSTSFKLQLKIAAFMVRSERWK